MFCSKCGNDIGETNIRFCPVCGEKISQMEAGGDALHLPMSSSEIKKNMEEDCDHMDNSSENEENMGLQEVQPETNWKDEVKKEWAEMNEEWNNDPDIPKSKTGKIVYGVIGIAVIIGIIVFVGYCGKQAFHTIASNFFFLKPTDEEVLNAATDYAEQWYRENGYPWAYELDSDSVEIVYKGKINDSCPKYSEEPSKHYKYSVSFKFKVDLPEEDDRVPEMRFDCSVSYGEGHVYVHLGPVLSLDPDYLYKKEINDALDEFGDEWNELFDLDDSP